MSNVFDFDAADPAMVEACGKARATFKYFWRELTWEYRRIIPALDLSAVKAPFSDAKPGQKPKPNAKVEQMWFSDIMFDGKLVTGKLLNSPNHLKSIKAGDTVTRSLDEISDWLYAIGQVAYGGHTVNLIRSRMDAKERKQHDKAWGLDLGDPSSVRLVAHDEQAANPDDEHPMSENMGKILKEELEKDAQRFLTPADDGWTTLQSMCLGGSYASVKLLIECGADVNQPAPNGMTPLQLAQSLSWERVVALLIKHGAK